MKSSASESPSLLRRCPVCAAFFLRNGRQIYCNPRCRDRAELMRRSSSASYKKKHREQMRKLRSEKLQRDNGTRPRVVPS